MSRRHPSVLYLLCLIEGCERFAASAMLSMFTLYLIQHRKFGDAMAVLVVGGFLAGSYLASWPGGWLADRFLGAPRSARLGTLLLAVGYAVLWIDSSVLSWPALGLVIVGQGFFRSALTTLVGQLYVADDERREAGFGFLYVSVNVGYLVGPVCAEVVRGRAGWPSIFGLATVALLLAQALFIVGGALFSRQAILASGNGDVLPSSRVEQSRIQALRLLSVVAVVFWLANQQSATSLMLFAKHNTNLSLSLGPWTVSFAPAHFTALHGALVLVFTPFLIRTLSMLRARKLAPSTPAQLVLGLVATAGAFAFMGIASLQADKGHRVHVLWLVGCYVLLSIAEVLWGALGLALLSKLAPQRFASRMAGLWYAAIAVGQLLGGIMGTLWQFWPHQRYFVAIAALVLLAATVLVRQLRFLNVMLASARSPSTR